MGVGASQLSPATNTESESISETTELTSDSGESSTGSCSVSESSSSSSFRSLRSTSSIIGSLPVGKRRKPAVKVAKRAKPNQK